MPRNLICESFDGAHASRSAAPGWRNIVGIRGDSGADVTSGHGMQCQACHDAMNAAVAAGTLDGDGPNANVRRAARLAALNKLRTFGGASGATALTLAELRLIFNAADKGDF
jgi:hypothetical protein